MGAVRRAWALPLAAHVVALVVLLVVAAALLGHPTSSWTSDDGAYALQAEALRDGRWTYDHRLAAFDDPAGASFPLVNAERSEDGWVAYARHPLWPIVLAGTTAVLGEAVGLHLVSLAGLVAAAAAAWCLAAAIDPRAARPGFWLLAAGPALAHGFLLWAHAPFAAVAGFGVVLALRAVRGGGRPLDLVGCGALLAVGVLLRSEGVLLAAAVGVVVGGAVLVRRGAPRALASVVAVGGPGAVALLAERSWVASIVGAPVAAPGAPSGGSTAGAAGRLSGLWHTTLSGAFGEGTVARVLAVAAALAPLLAVLALRRGGPRHDVVLGASLAVVLLLARAVLAPGEPIPGLLAAWPLVVGGLALAGRRSVRGPAAIPALVSLLVLAGVLATQYPEGGGLDWGGRFLAACWVPLAALTAAGAVAHLDRVDPGVRVAAVRAAVGVGAASALVCLVAVGRLVSFNDSVIADVEATGVTVAVATVPSFPRIAWRTHDEVGWLLATPGELDRLTRRLAEGGAGRVVVVGFEEPTGAGFASVRAAGDAVWVLEGG